MTTALYIHWPFCESKCPYCDFNSHVRENVEHERWLAAYLREIEYYSERLWARDHGKEKNPARPADLTRDDKRIEIDSIFFGGGTPSLMKPKMVAAMLETIRKRFKVADDIEITLEANPSSFETEKFKEFKQAGINRVSIGVQSFDKDALKFLGRRHDAKQAIYAIEHAGEIFGNFSFDLIYALPGQTIEKWNEQLETALAFNSPHISLYQLTIEKGTPFYSDFNNKKFELPEEGLQTDMYNLTVEKCKAAGLLRYEISNFAKPGFESRHNMNYWLQNEYIGIGPGAHGRLITPIESLSLKGKGQNSLANEMSLGILGEGEKNTPHPATSNSASLHKTSLPSPSRGEGKTRVATTTIHHPENWLEAVEKNGHGIQSTELLGVKEILEELIFMGLRIREGIRLEKFEIFRHCEEGNCLTKQSIPSVTMDGLPRSREAARNGGLFYKLFDQKLIRKLCDEGFMVIDADSVRLTDKGLLLHTNIVSRLISSMATDNL